MEAQKKSTTQHINEYKNMTVDFKVGEIGGGWLGRECWGMEKNIYGIFHGSWRDGECCE